MSNSMHINSQMHAFYMVSQENMHCPQLKFVLYHIVYPLYILMPGNKIDVIQPVKFIQTQINLMYSTIINSLLQSLNFKPSQHRGQDKTFCMKLKDT